MDDLLKKRLMLTLGLSEQQVTTILDVVSSTLQEEMLEEESEEEESNLGFQGFSENVKKPAMFTTYYVNDGMSILCIMQGPVHNEGDISPKSIVGSVTSYGDNLHYFF